MIPLRDNIPSDRFPVVTLAFIVINVLVFLFLQGPSFSFSAGDNVETKPVVEYGAIPYRITHPGDECDLVPGPGPTTSAVREVLVCEGTPEYREAAQAGVPIEDLQQPPGFPHDPDLDVHARRLAAHRRQHDLPVDLRQQRRGLDGPAPVRRSSTCSGASRPRSRRLPSTPDSTVPLVGASGAIAAVLGGYALLYPRARVLTLFFFFFIFFIEVPALLLLGLWIFLQFLPAVGQLATPDVGGGGGVAYWAHIGGFLFGLAAIKLFAHRRSTHYDRPKYPVY